MQRRPGLDLLRAIAVVWVMVFHSYFAGFQGGGVLRWSGWMGVDLFFALSGFLIGSQVLKPLAQGERMAFGDFYLRRAFRILPVYLLVLTVYLAAPALREVSDMRPWWQFATFSLNLWPAPPAQQALSHAWSLCVEEHFYLLFPLLAALLAWRPSMRRVLGVFAVLVLGGMALRAWLWTTRVGPVLDPSAGQEAYMRLLYVPTWARLDDLLGGVALAAVRNYRPMLWAWLEARANVVLGLGVALVVVGMAWFSGQRLGFAQNVFGYPLLALGMAALVCGAASPQGVLGRRAVPGATWLALASYSLYLTHKAVYANVHRWLGAWGDAHGWWSLPIYAGAVLAVGAICYYGVERPFLRLRARVRGRRTKGMAQAAA
ncbi:acyltransferase family protein [Oleiagrimonas soli]|uniref:Peptidoglycan/LPS O-acetylase OafA/YrhL n=1 Tax=Oleiagrimonas soli TaxID=1543381 RepID=A0A099D0P8_9GAMM|nr:acyltransferase [Oleiagrimonas soli]KGI78865.1 hypothetical protein LF63_0102760 [Oleiagrimonas soli]MBB6184333.1 peptidoglycan/LPS O-acetylase OafA/YrhL [Oleiagrimonas soli]